MRGERETEWSSDQSEDNPMPTAGRRGDQAFKPSIRAGEVMMEILSQPLFFVVLLLVIILLWMIVSVLVGLAQQLVAG